MGKPGNKLTDKERKLIIADYTESNNMTRTAEKFGLNVSTVSRIIHKDTSVDMWQDKAREKAQENAKDIIEYMESKKKDTQRVLDKILLGIEIRADELDDKTDIKGLATAYGIILDKQLKILEMQRGTGTVEQINKVQELLEKLDKEAQNDIE